MANRKISQLDENTAPSSDDLFVTVDVSEPNNSKEQNKSVEYKNLFTNIPNGSINQQGAVTPSFSFKDDKGDTGLYRSANNEIGICCNKIAKAKFTAKGFQIGSGTAGAPFHLFSEDTKDHLIVESTDQTGDNVGPNLVLYRNSDQSAVEFPPGDELGKIEFRGNNNNSPTAEKVSYAQITAKIESNVNDAEDGTLQLSTISGNTSGSRITIKGNLVGINETTPAYPLHITESVKNTALFIESAENDRASAANITLYHHRGNAGGSNGDILSSIRFSGDNNASPPETIAFGTITASIENASDGSEMGKIDFSVQNGVTDNAELESMVSITGANVTLNAPPILPQGAPSNKSSPGKAGQIAFDANFLYVCVADDTWKQVALGDF